MVTLGGAALLALLVSAASASSPGPPLETFPGWNSAALTAKTQGVLILGQGEARPFPTLRQLSAEDLKTAEAIWIWNERLAPVRLEGDLDFLFEPPTKTTLLEIRIDQGRTDTQEGAVERVVAESTIPRAPPREWILSAPVRMWHEVPEAWLPRWPIGVKSIATVPVDPKSEDWRLRFLGAGRGSWWTNTSPTAGRVALLAEAARAVELSVHGPGGDLLPDASLRVVAPPARRARQLATVARSMGEVEGFRFAAVPLEWPIQLVVEHPEHAPVFLAGTVGELPARISMEAGASVRGRFVDTDGAPLSALVVHLDAWLREGVAYPLRLTDRPSEAGAWSFTGLPVGPVKVRALGEGLTLFSRQVELPAGETDLGEIVLGLGEQVEIVVVDDLGDPVVGATVGAERGRLVTTDRAGKAVVGGLSNRGQVILVAVAEGHRSTEEKLPSPLPESVQLTLIRSFLITGQFLDEEGRVPIDATSFLERANRSLDSNLPPDGRIELELPPGEEADLTLRSTSTLPVKLHLEPGLPGEVRELGAITAPSGVRVRGWILSGADGAPLPGARVSSLRATDEGVMMAWMRQDTLEARVALDGAFELSGLRPGLLTIRIEAHGLAPRRIALDTGDEREIDLGEIFLDEGATVEVKTRAGDRMRANLDPQGAGLPMDLITRPVVAGVATFEHVPLGLSDLSIYRGTALVCRREIEVVETYLEVECEGNPLEVRGTVRVGDDLSAEATLIWTVPSRGSPEAIVTSFTAGGLPQQEVYGGVHPEAMVLVDGEGRFHSWDLSPGRWQVTRIVPGSSENSPSVTVELTEAPQQEVHLRYEGFAVEGWVVDEEGEPVVAARVRELSAGTQTFSQADGSFRISGLGLGTLVLQARKGNLRSDLQEVSLEDGREHEPVSLVLVGDERDQVVVSVVDSDRRPASAALVFLDTGALTPDLATSDLDGHVRFRQEGRPPSRVRAAAFHQGRWALGEWVNWGKASEKGLRLEVLAGGSALIEVAVATGVVQIQAPGGWNLTGLLTWLGTRPLVSSTAPLSLSGLPPGLYRFNFGNLTVPVTIRRGKVAEVELD